MSLDSPNQPLPSSTSSTSNNHLSSTTTTTSDPHARFVSSSSLDLLLIEIVPMAERITDELSTMTMTMTTTTTTTRTKTTKTKTLDTITTTTDNSVGGGGGSGGGAKLEDDELREATFYRLESLGYRVGQGLAERFSRDRPRFTDNLDVIKFICKDLWTILFRKQIDNLKTNHRGVYVLSDNSFRPLTRMSMAVRSEAVARAEAFLWFPCGLIKGCLANLGIDATVQAETSELPGATFQIKTNQAKT